MINDGIDNAHSLLRQHPANDLPRYSLSSNSNYVNLPLRSLDASSGGYAQESVSDIHSEDRHPRSQRGTSSSSDVSEGLDIDTIVSSMSALKFVPNSVRKRAQKEKSAAQA